MDFSKLSRRGFMRGAGVAAATTTLLDAASGQTTETAPASGRVRIKLDVNGAPRPIEVEPRTTLAEALRFELGLTGTKVVCDRGACSACTVSVGGKTPRPASSTSIGCVQSQVNGGVIHGVSYALFEDRKLDKRSGTRRTSRLSCSSTIKA